jgi:hypothetical protein
LEAYSSLAFCKKYRYIFVFIVASCLKGKCIWNL